ncbi:MAG TPA: hypothetical protein VGH02_13675 [Rhizomicrobium sp.]
MRARERGIALVSVLWGIAILSLIAAAMLAATITNARINHNSWALTRANALADAGVTRVVLALLDSRPEAQPRVDGVSQSFSLDGVRLTITVQDENGKIDINTASPDLLAALLASAGVRETTAGALADAIVSQRPQNAAPNIVAFHAVEDLRTIPGMTPDLLARVKPLLTVFSHNADVDQSVAPPAVLRALPGMTEPEIDNLLAKRNEAYRQKTAAATNVGAGRAFEIVVWVSISNVRLARRAVVEFTGDKDNPFWFVAWE